MEIRSTPSPAGDFELKLLVAPERVDAVAARLAAGCRPDPGHPANTVWTVYLDTPSLDLLAAKAASELRKTKVRVRWYGRGDDLEASPSFVEVKRRLGPLRRKLRRPLARPGLELLAPGRPGRDALAAALEACGLAERWMLMPALLVAYRRARFVEPFSGLRVALDRRLLLRWANPQLFPVATVPRPLPQAVVEIKGAGASLPPALADLVHFGCRQRSFSKYAEAASAAAA